MNVIDWKRVRQADELLDEAERLDPNIRNRPVPIREIMNDRPETTRANRQVTYSLQGAADVVGYSTSTLRRAIQAGEIKAAGGGRGEPYRISGVELERWWKNKGGGDLFPETEQPQ